MELSTERLIIRNWTDLDFPEFENTLNDIQRTCMGGAKEFLCWLISQYKNMDIVNDLISLGVFDKKNKYIIGNGWGWAA